MSECIELIADTQKTFSIGNDLGALSRIGGAVIEARRIRGRRRNESRQVVSESRRALDMARESLDMVRRKVDGVLDADDLASIHNLPGISSLSPFNPSSATHRTHEDLMAALDRAKFGLAKEINDVESTTHILESSLRRRREELTASSADVRREPDAFQGSEGHVLKLAVYRDLGITLHESPHQHGTYTKAVIRSPRNDNVHIVTLDSNSTGEISYADQLWTLASR
ncbi:putative kinetochore protein spc24 [Savitreella phatthalungensis]